MDMRSHGCCFVGAGFGMIKVWNACVPYLFFPGALSMNPFTESTVARPLASPGVAETAPAQKKSRPRFVKNLRRFRTEEHKSELQSLMRINYAAFCLKKKKN